MNLSYVFQECAPIFRVRTAYLWKVLADGTIVEYEIDREIFHNTDSRAQLHFSFVTPNAKGLDELNAAIRAAISHNPLLGPAFGSMMVNFTPQNDGGRVNAAYK